jgi:phosphoribosyl 1,2-cyclic phosphodiesterase
LRFTPLASGSKANAYLLQSGDNNLLIDFGMTYRRGLAALQEVGLTPGQLTAIFVTHGHIDHIRSVEKLAINYKVPVYGTQAALSGLQRDQRLTKLLRTLPATEFAFGGLQVSVFDTHHDAAGSVGYAIRSDKGMCTVITDTGKFDSDMLHFANLSDILVLESNYDDRMLLDGPYPWHLKHRIQSDKGHLSNKEALRFIQSVRLGKLRFLYLAHLSENNNLPLLAEKPIKEHLNNNGDVQVIVALQHSISPTAEL